MKKYIKSYEEHDDRIDDINLGEADFYDESLIDWDLIDGEDGTINPEDAEYYDKIFEVNLWCGVGYYLESYLVHADDAETALEKVVAFCEKYHEFGVIFSEDTIDPELANTDYYIYVDATMEGASQPYYVLSENARIREI